MTDTVTHAEQSPEQPQPFAELGLKPDEYQRIRDILDRRPTSSELAMYSVMWSEHCSYKSSKVHLRQFGEKAPATDALLVGIGENAGVVDIGGGWAVTFKVESHNHPSFVEPYQGAATGVGGIVRDILSMGARPLAVMDPLRFGPLDAPDTRRVLPGIVAGIGGYGNCLGLPNIGGEVVFDPTYLGNPLVNALCIGAMRHEYIHLASAKGVGNLVVLYGARTGGDGIGGVSVLASETFDEGGPTKRPSVQVATRSWRNSSSRPPSGCCTPASSRGSRTSAARGSPAPPASSRRTAGRHARVARPRAPCDSRSRPRRSHGESQERIARS
jgi:phosphoribosylformylglycinamidine synthase